MHAAPVVDVGAGVDIALRVRSEVIVLVVGRGYHSLRLRPVALRPPRLIFLNNWPELIIRGLIVSLLWIGGWPRWSVFTSINIGRPRSPGRLLILREGWRTVIILSGGWWSGRLVVIIGRFGPIIIIR